MPPRLPRLAIGVPRRSIASPNRKICLFCSISEFSPPATPPKRPRSLKLRHHRFQPRQQSTSASASIGDNKANLDDPRARLRDALVDLLKHAENYVNISRLQLALRGLEQTSGDETIRIAVLGLADGGNSLQKVKELVRAIVADPLKDEEEWERILTESGSANKPVLLRIGANEIEESGQTSRLVQELKVSSPTLNGHKVEILVLEMDPLSNAAGEREFENQVLVPTMDIPTSSTGRFTPITTPVHKALIVGDGILGAHSLLSIPYPVDLKRDIIGMAVDLNLTPDSESKFPFQMVDIAKGARGLRLFRESVDYAIQYEQDWSKAGMPWISEWLKTGTAQTEGKMKAPVRILVDSILKSTTLEIQKEQARRMDKVLSQKISPQTIDTMRTYMLEWAERAHTELRDQLDIAFNGKRWRKLGWWKLFWRVDDVAMIASDILNQRLLTEAEKEIIFIAGRIEQTGIIRRDDPGFKKDWAYKPVPEVWAGPGPPPPTIQELIEPTDEISIKMKPKPWPLHIPATRAFLSTDTVPALQALAQKLVIQTLSTSAVSTAFAGLIYVSSLSTGLYEVGAVAALGIVWSLRRMQGKWEIARKFWEGEVREEGRKAVRGVEVAVGNVFIQADKPLEGAEELEVANEAIRKAEVALEACK
jgi:hypothetical protein